MYVVYILYSAKLDRYYIGFTGDTMNGRLKKHLAYHKGFTGTGKDWKVVHTEEYSNKKDAMLREQQIKNWKSKAMINKLVTSIE